MMKMRERLEKRLEELRSEFELGQQKLADLEAEANGVRSTLLRISGAIQVLEEELGMASGTDDGARPELAAELPLPT